MRWIVYFSILCFLLVLIGGGTAAAVIFLDKDDNDQAPSDLPRPSPTDSPIVAPSSLSPISDPPNAMSPDSSDPSSPTTSTQNNSDNENKIVALILANAPDGGASLKDPMSPQSKAMDWLQLPINEGYSDKQLIQRYALATFYYATNNNENKWLNSSLWLTDTDECEWFSTAEDASNICSLGMYRELEMRQNGLVGSLPDEISLLTSLRTIRLPKNTLTGMIPSYLTSLTLLQNLDLSSNRLVGEQHATLIFTQINDGERDNIFVSTISTDTDTGSTSKGGNFLSQLGNMQALTHLDISENSFQGTIPTNVWGGEGSSSQLSESLKVLNLGSNNFYGTLPSEIGLLTQLTGLSVFDNSLSGQLPQGISNLSLLELLYVDSNQFTATSPFPLKICELRPTPLKEFWADCEKIECSCCTTCCTEQSGCETV